MNIREQYSSMTSRTVQRSKEYFRRNLIGRSFKPLNLSSYHAASNRLTPREFDETRKTHRPKESDTQYNSARLRKVPGRIFIKKFKNEALNASPFGKFSRMKRRANENIAKCSIDLSKPKKPQKKAWTGTVTTPTRPGNTKPIIINGVISRKPSITSLNIAIPNEPTLKCAPHGKKKSLIKLRELVQAQSKEPPRSNNRRTVDSTRKLLVRRLINYQNQGDIKKSKAWERARSVRNTSLELPDDSNYQKIVSFVEEIKSTMDLQRPAKESIVSHTSRPKKNSIQSKTPLSCRTFGEDTNPALTRRKILASRIKRHRQASLNLFSKANPWEGDKKILNRIESSPQRLTACTFQTHVEKTGLDEVEVSLKKSPVKREKQKEEAGNVAVVVNTEKEHGLPLKIIRRSEIKIDFAQLRKILHVQQGEVINLCPRLAGSIDFEQVVFSVPDAFFLVPKMNPCCN